MLDFSQVVSQIQDFAADQARSLPQLRSALEEAGRRMRGSGESWEPTRDKIVRSKTSWLVAGWCEPPDAVHSAPERATPCEVCAADGSQIVADRHDIALCYLLNIGRIALRYGSDASARLESCPRLAVPDEALLDEGRPDAPLIAPGRLAMRRLLAELESLAEFASECASRPPVPRLALLDSSLVLWQLGNENDEFRAECLETLLCHLEAFRAARVPVAGYLSRSRSKEVLNSLRIAVCPHEQANCDTHCPRRARPRPHYVAPDCAGTEEVTDADLFAGILRPGQRSALFAARSSSILTAYPDAQKIYFFYLHTGVEVARVEIPGWVAEDAALLAQTHALSYDQALKGGGYPLALTEAHELAVVRQTERDAFFSFLERRYVELGLPLSGTQKARAKRQRRV